MSDIAKRDQNFVTTLLAVSSVDGVSPVDLWADPVTHRLLVDSAAGSITIGAAVTGATNGLPLYVTAGVLAQPADPGADRIWFWDDSAGAMEWLTAGTGLTISGTTITATGTVAGSNTQVQFNNSSAFGASANLTWVSPALTIGVAGSTTGQLKLTGATSGTVTINTATAAGTWTLQLPANDGDSGQVLSTDGNGVTSWVSTGGVPTTITVANEATDTSCYPLFVTSPTGDLAPKTNGGFIFNSSTNVLTVSRTDNGAVGAGILLQQISTSPATNDVVGTLDFYGRDSAAGLELYSRIYSAIVDPTATEEDGKLVFSVVTAGSASVDALELIGSSLYPTNDDSVALGTTAKRFSDLFLAEGGVLNWDNGDVTLTQSGNSLTLAGGDLVLSENTSIALDPAGSADGKYTGITVTGTAGATLAFGDLIYLAVADSRWELADADAAATAGGVMMGMCVLAAAADGSATTILLQGIIRADAKFPALTVGAAVYVGETAGAIQVAIPTGADNIIRVVGFALTADEIYFNPSQDWQVTVA